MFYRWQLSELSWAGEDEETMILINYIFLPFLRSLLSVSDVEGIRAV